MSSCGPTLLRGTDFSIPLCLSVATHSIRRMQGNDDTRPSRASAWEQLDCALWGKSDGLPPGVAYAAIGHLLDTAAVAWCGWDVYLTEPQRSMLVSGMGLRSGKLRIGSGFAACSPVGPAGTIWARSAASSARTPRHSVGSRDTRRWALTPRPRMSQGPSCSWQVRCPARGMTAWGMACRRRRRLGGWRSCWVGITAGSLLSRRGGLCGRRLCGSVSWVGEMGGAAGRAS